MDSLPPASETENNGADAHLGEDSSKASFPPPGFNPHPPDGTEMTFLDHLSELRYRILFSVVSLLVSVSGMFFLAVPAIHMLKILVPASVRFVQLTPGESFLASFRLSLFLGAVVASPLILYQFIRFVLPGLKPTERQFLVWIVLMGGCLFGLGMAFAYFCILPTTLQWFLDYGKEIAENQMSIARYVEFCTTMILITGVLFELPVVLLMLSFTGLVSSHRLTSQWRMATIGLFVFAAIITPSQDPFSMLFVGLALMALYWVSILAIRLCKR
jgi:sec-independent protein translocase protein TatC